MDEQVTTLDRLLEVALLLQRDQDRFVVEQGTTPARVHLLWMLGQDGPSTQSRLATRLEVSPRNVTGLVDGLVADGLVTREPHATDRRSVVVTPTARGRDVVAELQNGRREFAALLLRGTSDDDLRTVTRVLESAIEALGGLAAAAAGRTRGGN